VESEQIIEELVRQVSRERGTTVILAGHNRRQTAALADRVVTLHRGFLVPDQLENLLAGQVRRVEDGVELVTRAGWTHRFSADELAPGAADLPADPEAAQVGVPAAALTVTADGALSGEVVFLRYQGDEARLRVQVAGDGPTLRVRLPRSELQRLGLTLGSQVHLSLTPGSVWLLVPDA
jgi:ABC-type sulfate/molybdate transport systems ATPase subunit